MKNENKRRVYFSINKRMLELANGVCKDQGLTLEAALNIYLYQVVYTRSIPFPVKLPSEEVLEQVDFYREIMKGMDDVEAGRVVPAEVVFEELRKKYGNKGAAMNYEMKLADAPFDLISSGNKTVEVRLYDEKRKQISVGDTIEFFRLNGQGGSVKAQVVALHRFGSFKSLFESALFSKTGSGELSAEEAAESMYNYYTKEQEDEYGVLGIEIRLLES